MSIAESLTVLKAELLQNLVPQVLEVLTRGLLALVKPRRKD